VRSRQAARIGRITVEIKRDLIMNDHLLWALKDSPRENHRPQRLSFGGHILFSTLRCNRHAGNDQCNCVATQYKKPAAAITAGQVG
jgi:hypothetical protein